MTEKVVNLNGGPVMTENPAPNPGVVEALEAVLERAKAGQLVGMCLVGMESTGQCPYIMVGRVGGFTMAGSLSALLFDMNALNSSFGEDEE